MRNPIDGRMLSHQCVSSGFRDQASTWKTSGDVRRSWAAVFDYLQSRYVVTNSYEVFFMYIDPNR